MTAHRCGTIGIAGRPNTGKSSLLNRLVGEKVSIVSPKPQTTRHIVTGILTRPDCQYVFVDAPGQQTGAKSTLHRRLNRRATEAAHPKPEDNGTPGDGQVGDPADVAAVHPRGHRPARRAGRTGGRPPPSWRHLRADVDRYVDAGRRRPTLSTVLVPGG